MASHSAETNMEIKNITPKILGNATSQSHRPLGAMFGQSATT